MRKSIFVAALLSMLLFIACSIQEDASKHSIDNNSYSVTSNDSLLIEETDKSSSDTASDGISNETSEVESHQKNHIETFFIGGNNAQGTNVMISVPENWKTHDSMQDTLISDNGCEARFECVEKTPNNIEVYFKGEEADHSNIIESEELDIPERIGRYYYFQREHDDGRKEDKVHFYVVDNDYIAIILLTPISGIDVKTQIEEFEAYLATLELG